MDIHHDTSLKFILEDNSISSTSKACICSYSGKGAGLWLVTKPYIHSFCVTHFTFTSMLCFCLGLMKPSTSSLLTCECGHGLDVSSTHLVRCSFGGQHIATHDDIRDVMYALVQESGHVVWKNRWYTFMLWISLRANLFMTQENQVFVAYVVVIDLTWEIMASSVINQLVGVAAKLSAIVKIYKYRGLHQGTILFWWPWRCTTHLSVIWIVSSGNVLVFSMIDNQEIIYPCFFAFKLLSNVLILIFSVLL